MMENDRDLRQPNVFVQPLGTDFAKAVVDGLNRRLSDHPPEKIAKVTLIVNTARMARRIRGLFIEGSQGFLPRIITLDQVDSLLRSDPPSMARSGLKRRLQLAELIGPVMKEKPELAARSSVYALSDSLASLMDEMQGEGVGIEAIAGLDVTDQSGHWQNTQALILIAHQYISQVSDGLDPEARQRVVVENLISQWEQEPPEDMIVLAGSTGSRGTTSSLMAALARLRNGAVILPGFDRDLPASVWRALLEGRGSEDHPQFRFAQLLDALNTEPKSALLWDDQSEISSADKNRIVSLALRPAPVTDAWLREGAALPKLDDALEKVTLLEAPTQRLEALAIAMRLRVAAETGQKAALITPDRMLSRQVAAALDRWNITPDDSAGAPLHLSAPGRFLRQTASLLADWPDAENLLMLLKHPLTMSGNEYPKHGLYTQQVELELRKSRLPTDTPDKLRSVLEKMTDNDDRKAWIEWMVSSAFPETPDGPDDLGSWIVLHRKTAELMSGGRSGPGALWAENAGRAAEAVFLELEENAEFGGQLTATEYGQLLLHALSKAEVRDRDAPHPGIMIWGTLEARVQGADLVVLGGLNDAVWPEAISADPWLNRAMRHQSGLLSPDRKIGLSAHDFQQAISAEEVWISRSLRSDDTETVASRWVNRFLNLVEGLPSRNGNIAIAEMRMRGQSWLGQAKSLEHVDRKHPQGRAAPRPPVSARPREFSVTEIKTLIRDPYAIYAKHCLGLKKLDPLVQEPDAPIRGIVVHEIMHRFVALITGNPDKLTISILMQVVDEVLEELVPWPTAKVVWRARLERVSEWIVKGEIERSRRATPTAAEHTATGVMPLPEIGGSIKARADRIDLTSTGEAIVYDYKSGAPPGAEEQKHFDKQLLIEAVMAENGAFKAIGPTAVEDAIYLGLGATPKQIHAPLKEESMSEIYSGLVKLLSNYLRPDQPYTSRRMLRSDGHGGDYDQLARFGEWEDGDVPDPVDLS